MTDIIPVTNNQVSVYIPFGGANVDLGEDAVAPSQGYPLLQYATGLPAQRPKFGVDGQPLYDEETGEPLMDNLYYAGFFTSHGKDKELDEAMQKRNVPWINIVHGNGEVVKHWMIEKPILFLIAKGVPSNAHSYGQYGMVYMWRQKRNSTKSETVLYVQAIIRQLLPDYDKPFVFTMKSTQTADALGAMRRQYKVLARAREEMQRAGHNIALPLWAYSALFGASKKQELRGQEGASKTIFPMISGIPDEITIAYLQKHEVPTDFIEPFKEMAEQSVEWAMALSERIASGAEPQEPWKGDDGVPSGYDEVPYDLDDHPFESLPSVGPGGEYAALPMESRDGAKPPAKTVPSNSVKTFTDSELKALGGTANVGQRRMLIKVGQTDLATKSGLSFEEAKKALASAARR